MFKKTRLLTIFAITIISSATFAEEAGITNPIPESSVGKRLKRTSESQRATLKNAKMKVSANPEVDEFIATNSVLLKNPKNIAMCLKSSVASFKPWTGPGLQNVWNSAVSFEPFVFTQNWQFKNGLDGSTEDYLEVRNNKMGLTYFRIYPDDFWNGGEMFLYRREGNMMKKIHHTTVKRWEVLKDGKTKPNGIGHHDGRLHYTDKGPIAKNGDILLIKMKRMIFPKTPLKDVKGKPFRKFKQGGIGKLRFDKGVTWGLDTSTFAPEGGSTTSMKMSLPGGENSLGAYHYYFAKYDAAWLGKLVPGKEYKLDIWLKQKDLTAPVTIKIGHYITKKVSITGDWQKISIDIPHVELKGLKGCEFRFGSTSAGTLWVDNCIIYQTDTEPFAILPKNINELKSFKPETIRWQTGGMKTAPSLDSWLNDGFRENLNVGSGVIKGSIGFALPKYLALCKEVNANTWLNLPIYSKKESLGLMEYLCGPASTPYGKKRAEHGHPEPWINDFDEITIEFANEAWNGTFMPLYFLPQDYAALANMIYSDMKSSPYFKGNENKFIFCAGGWGAASGRFVNGVAKDWGSIVVQDCTNANMYAHSNYIGGWDGITIPATTTEILYQTQLLYPSNLAAPGVKNIVKTIETLKRTSGKSDNPIELGVYEFGPGYALPNGKRPFIKEGELLGKSLALGVATLDTTMKYYENGFKSSLAFFKFGGGYNFNTHSDKNLKRPSPAYLALKMRNLYCKGDLMKVTTKAVKTMDIPEMMGYKRRKNDKYDEKVIKAVSGIEMSGCYVFEDTNSYSIMFLNRNVNEARKTKISLPKNVSSNAKLYKLTGKPWDTNLKDMSVDVQEEDISGFSKNYTFDLPACSVFIFVVEKK